jgi:mannose-1-phosphate guanylyltransferase/phosphomannomutase
MTFGKSLELLAGSDVPFSRLVDDLPEVHLVTRDVRTPWDLKGAVMRHVASVAAPGKLVLLDGVKVVENDRWVLVIPAPDEPLCRIWAEGPTVADAEDLADRYARIVEDVVTQGAEATS